MEILTFPEINQNFEEHKKTLLDLCHNLQQNPKMNNFSFNYGSDNQLLITLANSLLSLFININWVGPNISKLLDNKKLNAIEILLNFNDKISKNSLVTNFRLRDVGEIMDESCEFPFLLLLATIILENLANSKCSQSKISWLLGRCYLLHQSLLDNNVECLKLKIYNHYDNAIDTYSTSKNTPIDLLLEYALVNHSYWNFSKFEELLKLSEKIIGTTFELSGALGKTTKYQQKSYPQIFVDFKRGNLGLTENKGGNKSYPPCLMDIKLKDESLLDETNFDGKISSLKCDLTFDECKLLFCYAIFLKEKSPGNGFQKNGYLVVLERLIRAVNCPVTIRLAALILRSLSQLCDFKAQTRSLLQLEKALGFHEQTDFSGKDRSEGFWLSLRHMGTHWTRRLKNAEANLRLEMYTSALDCFRGLNEAASWRQICKCLLETGRRNDAKDLIEKRLLNGDKNHLLYLYLGHCTGDAKNYEMAWEKSTECCAEAQRCLGDISFRAKIYSEAVKHYKKALEINSLFPKIWHKLAHCHSEEGEIEKALNALIKCVNIDPDNAKTWNDLAVLHIKLKKYDEAVFALKQSTRIASTNWKVWDNLLTCAVMTQNWAIALNSLSNILSNSSLNAKSQFSLQPQMLKILSSACLTSISLSTKMEGLVPLVANHLSSETSRAQNQKKAHIFRVISAFLRKRGKVQKAIEFIHKEVRCLKQSGWRNDGDCLVALERAAEALESFGGKAEIESAGLLRAQIKNAKF